jgi:hypothetical protein
MKDFVGLASSTFLSVAITVVIFISKNWFSERLGRAIAHEYDAKLELVRDQLSQQQAIRTTALSALTAAHVAGYERRLRAAETLWAEVIHIREHVPLYAGHADIFTPDELPSALATSDMLRDLFEEYDPENEAKTLWMGRTQVEVDAAFAGEYLFALFYAYRAFVGRVSYLLIREFHKDQLRSWHDDVAIGRLLAGVLTPEEQTQVSGAPSGRMRLVQQLIESKMKKYIADVISGEASATFNLDQARRIIAAASGAEVSESQRARA